METDPTRMCELLVGLPDVDVVGVGEWPSWLRIVIRTRGSRAACASCATAAHDHGRREVGLSATEAISAPRGGVDFIRIVVVSARMCSVSAR